MVYWIIEFIMMFKMSLVKKVEEGNVVVGVIFFVVVVVVGFIVVGSLIY